MPDPVNLNQFRKKKAKVQDKKRADQNAARFGQSKTKKLREMAQKVKSTSDLDGHKLDP